MAEKRHPPTTPPSRPTGPADEDATFVEPLSADGAPPAPTPAVQPGESDDEATFIEAGPEPVADRTFIEPGGSPRAEIEATLIGAPEGASSPADEVDDRTRIEEDQPSLSPEFTAAIHVGDASADESDPFSRTFVGEAVETGEDRTMIVPEGDERPNTSGTDFVVQSPESSEDKTFLSNDGQESAAVVVSTEEPRPLPSGNKDYPRIGKFEIRKMLGQGAFGAVYLAYDPHLDRLCAIKVAKTGALPGKEDVDRFMREARSAAQLRHPHIVPVYEVGQLPNTNFIAYEYVEGTTLGAKLKEQKTFTPAVAVSYMRKIAEALHYAHSLGIVHRDMKPDNVLLDLHDEPHVADFGLARRDDADTNRTREGIFMGTPSYMSPEQASGQAHLADARSDVWSLGVMLQEMLTGVRPFRGNVTEVILAVQNQEPPTLRQVKKELPQDLETIVQRCLTKDKLKRFQTAEELAEELDRWERGEPILSRPISTLERTRLWARRNPTVAKLIGAVLATFFVGFTVSTLLGFRAARNLRLFRDEQTRRAITQLENVQTSVADSVPLLIDGLKPYGNDVRDSLASLVDSNEIPEQQRSRLLLCQSALFHDPASPEAEDTAARIAPQIMQSDPEELLMLTGLVKGQQASRRLEAELWRTAQRPGVGDAERFQALAALASLESQLPDWPDVAGDLVAGLLALDDLEVPAWLPVIKPVQEQLLPELSGVFGTGEKSDSRRRAAILLGRLFRDTPTELVPLVKDADPEQLPPLIEAFREQTPTITPLLEHELQDVLAIAPPERRLDRESEQAARLGLTLIALGQGAQAWPLFGTSINPHSRTWMIHRAAPAGIRWERFAAALRSTTDPVELAGLCLTLGEYGLADLPPRARGQVTPRLLELFQTHPHPGVHSAAEWVLRKWDLGDEVDALAMKLRSRSRPQDRSWQIDGQGVTFAIVDQPTEFAMGASLNDPQQTDYELQHQRLIPRAFGVATREVTVEEFLRFRQNHPYNPQASPEPDCPISDVTWYQAAQFCRWLSEQEGFTDDECCFPPIEEIGPQSVTLPADYLDRPGYRLPTEAEWEYVTRAGTQTIRPFGNGDLFLPEYAWYQRNSENHAHPVGLLKPNDWGLFDVLGNMTEWCQDWYFDDFPEANAEGLVVDGLDDRAGVYRNLRGVEYIESDQNMRVSFRDYEEPFIESFVIGFRLARTYRPAPVKGAASP